MFFVPRAKQRWYQSTDLPLTRIASHGKTYWERPEC
jgi:hypothetical protein